MKVGSVITASPAATSVPAINYHPDAPRPSFVWTVDLPLTWQLIDTHPAQWRVGIERLADDYLPGVRLRSAQKKLVKGQLEQVVAQSQKAGVLVTLVQPGIENEELTAATLLLRWADSSPAPASIISAEKQLHSHDPRIEQTDRGNSFVFASRTAQLGPMTDRRTAYTHQAFLPVAGTSFTLVVSGTAPTEETGAFVADLVRRLVSSVRTYPETAGTQLFDDVNSPLSEEAVHGANTGDTAENAEGHSSSLARTVVMTAERIVM